MNYLELFTRAIQESGIAGADPTTVLNQTSRRKKMVDWVQQAWVDIQLMRGDWLFMHSQFSFDTVVATRDYLAASYGISDMKLWDTGSFLIYETAKGESDQNNLGHLSYGKWREQYRARMGDRDDGRPQLITILPDNQVRFEPRPDKIYTIEGDYKRATQEFSANADVPTNLPDDFHMIIVWQALKYYAFKENAPDTLEQAEINFDALLVRLEIEQLPTFNEDFQALA